MNDAELRRWCIEQVQSQYPYSDVDAIILMAEKYFQYVRKGEEYFNGSTQAESA